MQSQRDTVTKLVSSLNAMTTPLVWFTPPTINTQALNSEEKRSQMSEESIAVMREMYHELGVTSAVSFVLDGPSFTRERVSESFDGVDYPASVCHVCSLLFVHILLKRLTFAASNSHFDCLLSSEFLFCKKTMDAGAQIIFNALDFLLPSPTNEIDSSPKKVENLSQKPYLGLMMICIALIGLFFFDGYFGVSYLAQFLAKDAISPGELYEAAFAPIFKRLKISTN